MNENIRIEDLPKSEQETILNEIREWEEEVGWNEISEEDLEKMAKECGY